MVFYSTDVILLVNIVYTAHGNKMADRLLVTKPILQPWEGRSVDKGYLSQQLG